MMQPQISYLVCGTPRSGSSLLCESLIATGVAGMPEEYFLPRNVTAWQKKWGVSAFDEYLTVVIRQATTPNGVFGSKMMWGYFGKFVGEALRSSDFRSKFTSANDFLLGIFPDLHYIWIRREDKVRQAVSHAKARQTNLWKVTNEESVTHRLVQQPVFSYQQIDYMVQELEMQDAAWQRYFADNHIQPFTVVYEDFVRQYEKTAIQILDYLNVPEAGTVTFSPRQMRKQADGESDQWVQRYHQLKMESKRHRLLSYANRLLLVKSQSARPGGLITRISS